MQRTFKDLLSFHLMLREINRRTYPRYSFEQTTEGGNAFKADLVTSVRHRNT